MAKKKSSNMLQKLIKAWAPQNMLIVKQIRIALQND